MSCLKNCSGMFHYVAFLLHAAWFCCRSWLFIVFQWWFSCFSSRYFGAGIGEWLVGYSRGLGDGTIWFDSGSGDTRSQSLCQLCHYLSKVVLMLLFLVLLDNEHASGFGPIRTKQRVVQPSSLKNPGTPADLKNMQESSFKVVFTSGLDNLNANQSHNTKSWSTMINTPS